MSARRQKYFFRSLDGFTLVEGLIIITLVSVAGVMLAYNFLGIQRKQTLTNVVSNIQATIEEARVRSVNAEDTMAWGVYIEAQSSPHTVSIFSYDVDRPFNPVSIEFLPAPTYLPNQVMFNTPLYPAHNKQLYLVFEKLSGQTIIYPQKVSVSSNIKLTVGNGSWMQDIIISPLATTDVSYPYQ